MSKNFIGEKEKWTNKENEYADSGFFYAEFGAGNWPLSQSKIGEFSQFSAKKIIKWMRFPILRLQKHAIKTAMQETFLSKGKRTCSFINNSPSQRMLLCNFRFVCLILMLLIHACYTCAVFGVCANDDFPRNESTWVLFLDILPILSSKLETSRLPNIFHPIRKADSELPIRIGFPTFFFFFFFFKLFFSFS